MCPSLDLIFATVQITFKLTLHSDLGFWISALVEVYQLLFSHSVTSDSLQIHGLQHTRLPCPSPSPAVCSNWCAIQSSHPMPPPSPLTLSLSRHQGFFPTSWLFTLGGQNIGASALASVLPMNIKGWFSLGLSSLTPQFESNSLALSPLYGPTFTLIHDY